MAKRLPLPVGQRAVVFEYGDHQTHAIENCIRLESQPPPLLSELQDGDVVIAVEATEVVWTDTVMATGQYQHQCKLPYSPGMSYAGRVVWATDGAKARGVTNGKRVAVAGGAGPRSLGRYQQYGGCASYAIAPANAIIRHVPEHWTMAEAACFAYGYYTAHYVLVEIGKLQKGETILINGASGGVGIPAVYLAKAIGARVIATTRSTAKVAFLHSLGVDETIVISDADGAIRRFREDVKKLTQGKGVDVAYDGVGGDAITLETIRCCRFGARYLIVGWAATPNVARGRGKRGAPNVNKIPTNLILMKGLQVMGAPAAIAMKYDHDGSMLKRRLKDIAEWTNSKRIPPLPVAATYALSDVKQALLDRVKSGSAVGSTIVCPPKLDFANADPLPAAKL